MNNTVKELLEGRRLRLIQIVEWADTNVTQAEAALVDAKTEQAMRAAELADIVAALGK